MYLQNRFYCVWLYGYLSYGSICRTIGGCISVVLAVLYLFSGGLLYGLFFEEEQIIAIGVNIMRTGGSYFFCYVMGWGIVGIWMGVVADQLSRLVLASIRFKQGKWIQIKI